MNVDSIRDGIVIDHIAAGCGMKLYRLLGLENLEAPVAMITNVVSGKLGRKDIIKIDAAIDVDLDIIGYVDPGATVNIIRDGELKEKKQIEMPEKLVNVLFCKNPRCITSCEQELDQIFVLTDRTKREYRCMYCETKGEALSTAGGFVTPGNRASVLDFSGERAAAPAKNFERAEVNRNERRRT